MNFQLHIFAALAQEERGPISEQRKAALAEATRRQFWNIDIARNCRLTD